MDSSDLKADGDKKGLPADAALPLGFREPTEREIIPWMRGIQMTEVSPQALLRDLHRPEKQFGVRLDYWDKLEMIDIGGSQALNDTKAAMRERYWSRPHLLHSGTRDYHEAVQTLLAPRRVDMRKPYVSKK